MSTNALHAPWHYAAYEPETGHAFGVYVANALGQRIVAFEGSHEERETLTNFARRVAAIPEERKFKICAILENGHEYEPPGFSWMTPDAAKELAERWGRNNYVCGLRVVNAMAREIFFDDNGRRRFCDETVQA